MKTAIITVVAILSFCSLIFVGYVAFLYYTTRTIDQTIAANLSVSSEWTEITPDPPLSVLRREQNLNIRIAGFEHEHSGGHPLQIRLPDGTIIKPEIELYDEYGNKFEFLHNGFSHSPPIIIFVLKYDPQRYKTLPTDRRYTKLRIRSDVPFLCERLNWRNFNSYYSN